MKEFFKTLFKRIIGVLILIGMVRILGIKGLAGIVIGMGYILILFATKSPILLWLVSQFDDEDKMIKYADSIFKDGKDEKTGK